MSAADVITCLGDLMLEHVVPLPQLPPKNRTLVLDGALQQVGGSVFNLCWYLSRFGRNADLVGPAGRDDLPLITRTLAAAGISASGLLPVVADTDRLIAMLVEGSHHSLYFRAPLPADFDVVCYDRCRGSSWLILAGSRHRPIRTAYIRLAEDRVSRWLGFSPSYSIYEYTPEEFVRIYRRAQVSILNADEAEHACRMMDLPSAADLSRWTDGVLIVTEAERGARLYEAGRWTAVPSCSGIAGDVIGTGDAFFAGFAHDHSAGRPPLAAARFGAVLAAHVALSGRPRAELTDEQIRRQLTLLSRSSTTS
jgi:sugar/nucleoside kinase (ribokinase family)